MTTSEQWLAEAKKAADGKRFSEARSTATKIMKQYPTSPEAAEAKTLLDTWPHPDGRLVCGFDNRNDLRMWRVERFLRTNMTFEITTDPKEIKEGEGACHLSFPRDPDYTTGAIILELGKIDLAVFKGLSLWIFEYQPQSGHLELAFIRPNQSELPWIDKHFGGSNLGACLYRTIPLDFVGWKQVKVAVSEFQARGAEGASNKITWRDAGALVLYDNSRRGIDIFIDSLRFLEAEKK
jgi:hypothetical protein